MLAQIPSHRRKPALAVILFAAFGGAVLLACGGFVGLVRFDFAARELPEATMPLVQRALANEQAVTSTNDCRDDTDDTVRHPER